MDPIRKSLEEAIQLDPRNLLARKILADWLDEFSSGESALAAKHRSWTVEKQVAFEYMSSLFVVTGTEVFVDSNLDAVDVLLNGLKTFLRTGFKLKILMYRDTISFVQEGIAEWATMWLHFKTLTGIDAGPLLRQGNLQHNPFTRLRL